MARLAILGPTRPGRYPRWGFLDRFETNEVLPRACGATLAFLALLVASTIVAYHLRPAKERRSGPSRERTNGVVQFSESPVPLPPMVRPRLPAPVSVSPPRWGALHLVDATVAEEESIGPPSDAGRGAGEGASDAGQEGDALYIGQESPPLPTRDETFVVFEHEPELVWMREPAYPEIARDAGIEGLVLVRVLVAADGTVLEVTLLRSVLGLDEAALEAAKTAVFRPALQQGLPVQAWVVIPIDFSLRADGARE